jgi:hypothetical protein
MIRKLWNKMQGDPFYKGKTTFMVVPDHGRGVGDKWISHGSSIVHSNEAWFMVMGPDTPPLGEMKVASQIYQTQFAKTIAALLRLDYIVPGIQTGQTINKVIE